MDDDVIEALADAFAQQLGNLGIFTRDTNPYYRAAIMDDIIAVATVINAYEPTYDLRYFYRRAGYPEPYPVHEMR